ncbi:MAG: hypothetical protein QM704_10555 [Anaeromyxobacteraceae bacterium]
MDGFELARRLKAEPNAASARLIALSGYARPEDVARAHHAGFDGHLAKPASLEAIEELLSSLERQGGAAEAKPRGEP